MIITIDGPAAAGKGTLANKLAQKYKLAYFDTGMVYRAVGLDMVLQGFDPENSEKALSAAKNLTFAKMIDLSKHIDFRSNIGGQAASKVASLPEVRSALLKMQQDFALNPQFADGSIADGVVYDGRDTGTVVCPDADLKLFITASPEVRAKRRYDEFVAKGMDAKYEDVLRDVKIRDERDSTREVSPLRRAEDAVYVDTTDNNIERVVEEIMALINAKRK